MLHALPSGIEIVFIVIANGAGGAGLLVPARFGAFAALCVVILLGLVLHRPMARIPENALTSGVGVLLCAFATFWVGEGMGLVWPRDDITLALLVAGYFGAALVAVRLCCSSRRAQRARRR